HVARLPPRHAGGERRDPDRGGDRAVALAALKPIITTCRTAQAHNRPPITSTKRETMKILISVLATASATVATVASSPALAAGPTNVNSCGPITSPGSYLLTRSLNVSGNCFDIQSDDVTFDTVAAHVQAARK